MAETPATPDAVANVSRAPPAPEGALREIEGTVAQLRLEVAAATDKSRQARLLSEIGEIEERAGDETGAAKDYLAAYNTDPGFREPLEALVRLLERRRSVKNLGKIVDALLRAAQNPDERARALLAKAAYLEDQSQDLAAAKGAALEATDIPPPEPEGAQAWLMLEILAARLEDGALREQALGERAKHAGDAAWRALLNMDLAKVRTASGDVDGALEALQAARAGDTEVTWAALVAAERLVRSEPGIAGSAEAQRRARGFAEALELQATILHEAMQNPPRGDALGVPRWMRTPTHMAGAWLRAAETRRAGGQLAEAAALVDRALEVISTIGSEQSSPLEPALINARIRIAEQVGDTALAARLAERRLQTEKDGGIAAALAMRIAEHAASEGDADAALDALLTAIKHDPSCIPARALQLDLLADSGDPSVFAGQLEAFAEHLTNDDARGRAYLLAAFVWGARAKDSAGAKAALGQAAMAQVPVLTLARVAKCVAAACGDKPWYEEASRRVITAIASGPPRSEGGATEPPRSLDPTAEAEVAQTWLDIARTKLARGDNEGARAALAELRKLPSGGWLSRALEAFLPPQVDDDRERRRAAIDELAEMAQDRASARAMGLVSAIRAHRAGDKERARQRLRELADHDSGDVLVATYLADLERIAGDSERASAAAAACGALSNDADLATALLVEAGFERWRAGDRLGAISAFDEAATRTSPAPLAVLGWAGRGAGGETIDARKSALERAVDGGADPHVTALERFCLEAAGGDPDEAANALASIERATDGSEALADIDLSLAASIGRLVWPMGVGDRDAISASLERIEAAGSDAKTFAAAERVRIARESEPDRVTSAAQAWFEAGGGVAAAMEWLAAAMTSRETEREVEARLALAGAVSGSAREQLLGTVAVVRRVHGGTTEPLVQGVSQATRLVNLELSPPGCDPRRRAHALAEVDGALGEGAAIDALALGAWSMLAGGEVEEALEAFTKVTAQRPEDIASWEGLRAAAEAAEKLETQATASEMIGKLSASNDRGAEMWEKAGLDWLELKQPDRAEAAWDAAFARDPHRSVAFDKLFRRVRERGDADKILDLIARRLAVADEPPEMTKLFWEQARALRAKGDQDGALKALENVMMLEPDHAGALALTGEIAIRRGLFEEAASALARLASLDAAPAKNRVTAGVAAVDLYENKLDRHDKALEVLLVLHRAGLTTLPVRERLARAAGRTGAWREATSILEELMNERVEAQGRVEAARLAMAIYRDRLGDPNAARSPVTKLLEEAPGDGEAVDTLLTMDLEATAKRRLLERSRLALMEQVRDRPTDLVLVRRLSNVARALGDDTLWQAALSTSIALGEQDPNAGTLLLQLQSRKHRTPQIALNEPIMRSVLAPGDDGPLASLFHLLAPTLAEALGPSLTAAGVSKREKIDPRAGLAVRNEIATWAGAFGIREFDLYVGGRDPMGVVGVPGEVPSLVIGSHVNTPLPPATRGRVARELLALLRGSTITRWRDDTTIAAIVVAACNLGEVRVEAPPYAMLAEVERLMSKVISRKTRRLLPDVCRAIVGMRADARAWAHRALMSHNRMAAVASGDPAAVILDVTGQPLERLPALIPGDSRVEELIRFILSAPYLDLRRSLGLESP